VKKWRRLGVPMSKRKFVTTSGIEIKEIYKPDDLKDFDPLKKLGKPGEFPFTRGVYPSMYREKIWTMRQYAGYGTAEETNKRFHYLLNMGQTGLSLAFDLPTQLGYDPDHPFSSGEVGKTGVSISTWEDMDLVFKEIPLERVSTSMTINATCIILLAMYIVVAERRGIERRVLKGTVQNDILKEYVARGNYIYPVEPSMRLVGDTIEFCSREMPKWNPISISGYHFREAGSNAVQEVAFTFSDAIAYIEEVRKRGLDLDEFAPRLSFFFSADRNFFEEIAKFRAARRIWAKIMRDKFGARKKESWRMRFHTQTAGSSLVAHEPLNNVIRVTLQALSAVLGGTQSLHTNAYDEALSLPTDESVRIALRTQQIIAYESGVADTVDPLAGSYFLEKLTDELEERIWEYIDKIEKIGGAVNAVINGFMKREIEESAYNYQREIEKGERTVVGVNAFVEEKRYEKIKILRVDPELEERRVEEIKDFRKRREWSETSKALKELKRAAEGEENLLPYVIEAVKKNATLGEISDSLKEVFGCEE
jgi:methylmalonyl-CoA mutase N-terminal domain/subunit